MKRCIQFLCVLMVFVMLFQHSIFAGGGSSNSANYYSYDDLLEAAETYSGEFRYDNYSYSENGDVSNIIPGLPPEVVTHIKSKRADRWRKSYRKKAATKSTRRVRDIRRVEITKNGKKLSRPTADLIIEPLSSSRLLYDELKIDWANISAFPSDMIFVRGQTINNRFVTTFLSSWNHVALIWNLETHEVLESMPDEGVKVRYSDQSWKSVIAFGIKSVDPFKISHFEWVMLDKGGDIIDFGGSDDHYNAMMDARDRYLGIDYWPNYVDSEEQSSLDFFAKWSNKNDFDSMYCSKLVYWAFKDYAPNVNLDSNRTRVFVSKLRNSRSSGENPRSWMGVSPDDIWGSNDTETYWELEAPENLYAELNG